MIAQELERVAREPVRSRLGDRVDRRARMHAVLRGETARRHAEFLERVGEREWKVGVLLGVVVRCAVERIADAGRQAARDRDIDFARETPRADGSGLDRGADAENEVHGIAPVQRQFEDARVLDDVTDAGALDVHERRSGVHRDGFFERADLEHRVDRRGRADLQRDACLHVRAESLEADFELVRSRRKI